MWMVEEASRQLKETDDEHRQTVKDHKQSFPTVESHYCRKESQRLYLDSKLTIQRMYELYTEKCKVNTVMLISQFHQEFTERYSLTNLTWASTNRRKVSVLSVQNLNYWMRLKEKNTSHRLSNIWRETEKIMQPRLLTRNELVMIRHLDRSPLTFSQFFRFHHWCTTNENFVAITLLYLNRLNLTKLIVTCVLKFMLREAVMI